MKETIYTIPLNEALDEDTECMFCVLEKKLEKEQIEYALGPAMMEPDYRILSNEKGYCRHHLEKLIKSHRALPFALVQDTRIDEIIKNLTDVNEKKAKKKTELMVKALDEMTKSCIVCDRVNATMEKFIDTFWYLYKREPDFRKRILNGKGFCVHHFADILKSAQKNAGLKREEYTCELLELEISSLKKIKEDVHDFTKQFDYRCGGKMKEGLENAHIVCGEKLSKYCEKD